VAKIVEGTILQKSYALGRNQPSTLNRYQAGKMESYKTYIKKSIKVDIGKMVLPSPEKAVEYMKQNFPTVLEALKDK
jgi:hypothetical protein